MKFGPDVLIEIISIVQKGMMGGSDVSQSLREIDVSVDTSSQRLILSSDYVRKYSQTSESP